MNRDLIIKELDLLFEEPKCELEYSRDYELLLSVMLSAQTTDKRVNIVTRDLYSKYDSLENLLDIEKDDNGNYNKDKFKARIQDIIFNSKVYIKNEN